jgi:hypothetical protein
MTGVLLMTLAVGLVSIVAPYGNLALALCVGLGVVALPLCLFPRGNSQECD